MKTIRQIADELGVSKQAVRDKIAKLNLQSTLRKNANQFAIDEMQEILIKSAFDKIIDNQLVDKQPQSNDNQLIAILQQNQTLLQQQLEEKDKQIAVLHKLLEQQHTLSLGDKQTILQLSSEQLGNESATENPPQGVKGWFSKFKK